MSFRSLRFFCILCLDSVVCCAALAATPATYLYLNSQPGDDVGQGRVLSFTPADGTFSVSGGANRVSVSFNNSDYSQYWTLQFATPASMKFAKGQYEGAQNGFSGSPTRPGIAIFGDGNACTSAGRFLVTDFMMAADGTVSRLAIDFEHHCVPFVPALYGSIRYNSSITRVPRLGIGAVTALKGNAGTSDALATIALSMPSPNPVTAQYVTADGTALQGLDYQASSGAVSFPAGSTAQTVVVPILGDRLARGNKQFKLLLKSPIGSLVGTGSANVLLRDPNITMTALAMSSETGDYVGQGQQYLITPSDGTFTAINGSNVVQMVIHNGDNWETDFAGPGTTRLLAGEYPNAQMYPFQPAGVPGMNVAGDGRACEMTGSFDVLKASYSSAGVLQSFAADFEQVCQRFTPALYGWVRFHTLLQQFSVSNAVVQGSSAVFTVTLNPSLSTPASVTFSTADGTAIAGRDYVSTAATLIFSPGMLAQTVSVPLYGTGPEPITFYGQLATTRGAAAWVRQGSATF